MTETLWPTPQKLAPKPPPGEGRWPAIYCFRCECVSFELVRDGAGERLEAVNGAKQHYFVLSDPGNPTNDGSRLKVPLCGKCSEECGHTNLGQREFGKIVPFFLSGIEQVARAEGGTPEFVDGLRKQYQGCYACAMETEEEGLQAVAQMLAERQLVVRRLLKDAVLKERAERSAAYKAAKTSQGTNG